MISFEQPSYLLLAWALPALLLGYWWSRRVVRRAWQAAPGSVKPDSNGRHRRLVWLPPLLRLLALAGLVLALAAPRTRSEPTSGQALYTGSPKIVFVVDVSNSMLAADVLPDRLSQAKRVVAETVRNLSGEQVSVVVFAGNALLYMPLTTDYAALDRACSALSPSLVAHQGTSLAGALELAGQVLGTSTGQARIMCVLSDGESHTSGYAPLADSLQRAGIELVAIGVGTAAGAFMPVSAGGRVTGIKMDARGQPIRSSLRKKQMRRIVQDRADRYIQLDSWRSALPRLREVIRTLSPSVSPAGATESLQAYQRWLLFAFSLLLFEVLLPPRRQIRSNETN